MRNGKLRLDLDELSVESFAPAPAMPALGTVHGRDGSEFGGSECNAGSGCGNTCDPSYCIPQSCDWTRCQNLSCLAGNGCGSGSATLPGEITCSVQCVTTNPPPIE